MISALPVLIISAEASRRDRIADIIRNYGLRPFFAHLSPMPERCWPVDPHSGNAVSRELSSIWPTA